MEDASNKLTERYKLISEAELLLPYSVNRAFDEAMRCYSFGYQLLHYYRYGERKSCSLSMKKFRFAMSLSVLSNEDKIEKIKKFEDELVKGRDLDVRSTLAIWELREEPISNFPSNQ